MLEILGSEMQTEGYCLVSTLPFPNRTELLLFFSASALKLNCDFCYLEFEICHIISVFTLTRNLVLGLFGVF